MKIFKSIKWRLQIWYGLILVLVLAGFGFTAYQLERGKMYRQVDGEFVRRVGALANLLHRPPPREPNGNGQSFDRPPPGQFPDDGPPEQNSRPPLEFHLPPEAAGLFGASDPHNFYFIINSRNGSELARSTNAPKVVIVWDRPIGRERRHIPNWYELFPFHIGCKHLESHSGNVSDASIRRNHSSRL